MELYKASRQWATRPDDERFGSLDDLILATANYARTAREATVKYSDLRVLPVENDLRLVGQTGQESSFSHWSFGQLSARVGAPASYLRELPATLAADNLNHGLTHRTQRDGSDDIAKVLLHQNGGLVARAFVSDRYARIWDYEVAERLRPIVEAGWKVPPAVTDGEKPSGLYASDHDAFMFLVNESLTIHEPGNPDGLFRGVFVENSEVGAAALKVTGFLYRRICGNHIVWGASRVLEIAVRHVGDISGKSSEFFAAVRKYADSSASDEEAQIERAFTYKIGDTKEEVLDRIFGKGILSRTQTFKAYDVAERVEALDPRTAWGLAQGVTRIAREIPYADRRTAMDKAAGKILQMAF